MTSNGIQYHTNGLGWYDRDVQLRTLPGAPAQLIEDPRAHGDVAHTFMNFHHRHADAVTLAMLPDGVTFVEWNGKTGYWRVMVSRGNADGDEISNRLMLYLSDCLKPNARGDGWQRYNPSITDVANVRKALVAECRPIEDLSGAHWLGKKPDDALALVAVKNGILNVKDWTLRPHTPRWLVSSGLNVEVPAKWLDAGSDGVESLYRSSLWYQTMTSVFLNDHSRPEQMRLWQELTGYAISSRRDLELGMVIVGPTGSAKGTYYDTLEHLLGEGVGTFSLLDMATQSGVRALETLNECKGARVIVDPEVRVPDAKGQRRELVRKLLSITSNEKITVSGIRQSASTQRWGWFPIMLGNEQFVIPDPSRALAARFHYITTQKGYRGTPQQDVTLKARLKGKDELALFALWCLDGLRRLIEKDWKFTVSRMDKVARAGAEAGSAPSEAFFDTYLERARPDIDDHWEYGKPGQPALSERVVYLAFLAYADHNDLSDHDQTPLRLFRKAAKARMPWAMPEDRNQRRVRYSSKEAAEDQKVVGLSLKQTTIYCFMNVRWKEDMKPDLDELEEVVASLPAAARTKILGDTFSRVSLVDQWALERRPGKGRPVLEDADDLKIGR